MEAIIEKLNELDKTTAIHESRACVRNDVLAHVLREVCEHLGVNPRVFDEHCRKLRNYYHSQYLDRISQDSKYAAGKIDDRPISEIDTGEEIQNLFPRR